jgi:predicted transcriptional regulator
MRTVILDVRPLSDTLLDFAATWKSGRSSTSRISFASPALLFKMMTGKRWELLTTLTGAEPVTIREAARRVGRDVKAVHGDVRALLDAGILRRTDDKKIVFPFDELRVDFVLNAA